MSNSTERLENTIMQDESSGRKSEEETKTDKSAVSTLTIEMEVEPLTWAVVAYDRSNFTEEFIERHPMDFYEKEEDISKTYDIYLMGEQGGRAPYVESRIDGYTFRSELTFFDSVPFQAEDRCLYLKHLRMLLGTEDYSYVPFDFADISQIFDDKHFSIDAKSFSSETSVKEIIKWVRGVDKRHGIKNHEVVIVFEGKSLSFATELISEISERFGVELGFLAVYPENVDPEVMNISLWSYDAVSEIKSLRRRWDKYCDQRLKYASGETEIDMDDYCELVKKTWWYLFHVDDQMDDYARDNTPYVEVNRAYVLRFSEYVKMVERITYYSVRPEKDRSKDYHYTVTAMLADELSRLAAGKAFTPPYYHEGEYMVLSGPDMDVTLAAPHPGSDKRVRYDILGKNYQVLYEAAKRLNEIREE